MLHVLREIAEDAGRRIQSFYRGSTEVTYKADDSPVTAADRAADELIGNALTHHFPGVPILSEESPLPAMDQRRKYSSYFLVDPLDGTREFIKRNGELTVNIAYCEASGPVAGVVHAPILQTTHYGQVGKSAFVRKGSGAPESLAIRDRPNMEALRTAVSRSHPSEQLAALLAKLPNLRQIPMGSSLKMVKVAEGEVDFYLRIGRLMEWDTAAACAVLKAVGLAMTDLAGAPIRYNKPSLDHGGILIAGSEQLHKHLICMLDMT